MNNLKIVIITLCLLLTGIMYAQKPVSITCRTGEGVASILRVWKVENGQKKSMAEASYGENNYYSFGFIPEYSGFYVVGNPKGPQCRVYLKEGDHVSFYMDRDTVYLTGKHNTPENQLLLRWENLSRNVGENAVRVFRDIYEEFFPKFEALQKEALVFKQHIKTRNSNFNELLERVVDSDMDRYALNFLYTPRSKHPSKEQRIDYYKTIVNPDKFKDETILQLPDGMDFMQKYIMYFCLENQKKGDQLKELLAPIPNGRLQAAIVMDRAQGFGRSYFEYLEFVEEAKPYVNTDQLKILEAKASALYQAKQGEKAIDFTYPDADGKMHSLSDYKGKVVLVDVWATWCGPCRGELPHLKKLEEEMEGTDVVFIGVSLDEEKNREKWKKFLIDEGLPGVQLFANGWSKITKDYKITGIPRFMVFGRDGNVVESNAPRPSNPALKGMLEAELKK